MCGRFVIKASWAELREWNNLVRPEDYGRNDPERHNVIPTQMVPFVIRHDGQNEVRDGQWWLVPAWAKANVKKYPTFNAKSETAHEKSSFKASLKSKRCLIPADAYIEWTKNADDGGKDPHVIHMPDWESFAFAGLWAYNKQLDLLSCTVLTAPAVPEIEHLHKRMPIILKQSAFDAWLDPDKGTQEAMALYGENRNSELVSYQVGRAINKNDATGAELLEAI